jgi:hypothetical protein
MEMQQIIEMLAKMEADRKTDKEEMLAEMKANQAKADTHQAKMEALTGPMQAELKSAIEEKMKDAMKSMRSELDETIRQRIEIAMTNTSRETHNFQTELTGIIEKNTSGTKGSGTVPRHTSQEAPGKPGGYQYRPHHGRH